MKHKFQDEPVTKMAEENAPADTHTKKNFQQFERCWTKLACKLVMIVASNTLQTEIQFQALGGLSLVQCAFGASHGLPWFALTVGICAIVYCATLR